MAASAEIINNCYILPLHAHMQARQLMTKMQSKAIIYYLLDEATSEVEQALYIYYAPLASGDDRGSVALHAREEINFLLGRFNFREHSYQSIEHMLRENGDIQAPLLKQKVIAAYLNSLCVPFTSTFLLTKGALYKAGLWYLSDCQDIIVLGRAPQVVNQANQEVVLGKPVEFIFHNGDKDFELYRDSLQAVTGLNVRFRSGKYNVTTFEATAAFDYWAVERDSYSNILRRALNNTVVPSLKEISLNRVRQLAYKTSHPVCCDNGVDLPKDLTEDPRFFGAKPWKPF